MKTGQFSINQASAIVLAAFLALPMHSLAQSNASAFGGRAAKPVCVYKGVMSDAEIEVCTGYRIHYYYAIDSGHAGQQATNFAPTQHARHVNVHRAPARRAQRLRDPRASAPN